MSTILFTGCSKFGCLNRVYIPDNEYIKGYKIVCSVHYKKLYDIDKSFVHNKYYLTKKTINK